jgi:hypothetical protein
MRKEGKNGSGNIIEGVKYVQSIHICGVITMKPLVLLIY